MKKQAEMTTDKKIKEFILTKRPEGIVTITDGKFTSGFTTDNGDGIEFRNFINFLPYGESIKISPRQAEGEGQAVCDASSCKDHTPSGKEENNAWCQDCSEMLMDIQQMIVLLSALSEPHTKGEDYLNELKNKYIKDVKGKCQDCSDGTDGVPDCVVDGCCPKECEE